MWSWLGRRMWQDRGVVLSPALLVNRFEPCWALCGGLWQYWDTQYMEILLLVSWPVNFLAYSVAPAPANRMSQEKSNTLQGPISCHHLQTLVSWFNCIFLFTTGLIFSKFHVSKNQNGAIICVQFEKPQLLTKWKKKSLFKISCHILLFPLHHLASKSVQQT